MKIFKSVSMEGKILYLKTDDVEVEVQERKKKTGTVGSIWSESFAKMAGKQGEWIIDGKKLRAGVSALVLTLDGVILNRFDSGHPTAANKLSTPAGIWEEKQSLLDSALRELGEEVIIADRQCGFWTYKGQFLAEEWVREYAFSHGMKTVDFKVEIFSFEEAEGTFEIYLDDEYQGNALLAYEPETGGIEILFVFETNVHMDGMLKDGERFKDQWLNREVGVFSLEDILNEENKISTMETVEVFLNNL